MTFEARPAAASDVAAIEAVVNRAYDKYVERMERRPAPMMADYAQLVADHVVTVLADDEHVVGVLIGWVDGDSYYVDNVAADPSAGVRGLGLRLLDIADEQAHAAGCTRMWLYTNAAMTENLGYYERRGFTVFDRRLDDGYDRVFFERPVVAR